MWIGSELANFGEKLWNDVKQVGLFFEGSPLTKWVESVADHLNFGSADINREFIIFYNSQNRVNLTSFDSLGHLPTISHRNSKFKIKSWGLNPTLIEKMGWEKNARQPKLIVCAESSEKWSTFCWKDFFKNSITTAICTFTRCFAGEGKIERIVFEGERFTALNSSIYGENVAFGVCVCEARQLFLNVDGMGLTSRKPSSKPGTVCKTRYFF